MSAELVLRDKSLRHGITSLSAESLLSTFSKDQPCVSPNELQLCLIAVNLSVQLTAQIIFDYLDSLGILNYQNLTEHIEKTVFRVIQGGLTPDD